MSSRISDIVYICYANVFGTAGYICRFKSILAVLFLFLPVVYAFLFGFQFFIPESFDKLIFFSGGKT